MGSLWTPVYWTVIGVHSYDGHPNSAQRFTNKMISRFLGFMNCLKLKSLRSFAFPNVYVRCDGSGVTEHVPSGGGTVNCLAFKADGILVKVWPVLLIFSTKGLFFYLISSLADL